VPDTAQEGEVPLQTQHTLAAGCSQLIALPGDTQLPAWLFAKKIIIIIKKTHFLSRSDHSVPFSGLNFRRHQRAAESWWEPSSQPRKGEKQIKPKQ